MKSLARPGQARKPDAPKKTPPPPPGICRHCKKAKIGRPRRLCWHCFYAPGVRDRYTPKTARFRCIGAFVDQLAEPTPTAAMPGTPAKIAAMAERAARGESLFHPEDA